MALIDIPGIGEKTASALENAGIDSIHKLLHTYPRTYRTYTATDSKEGRVGDWVILLGKITRPISKHVGRTTTQLATLKDRTGVLTLRWFNMPYIVRSINPQDSYKVMGKLESFRGVKQIVSPQIKIVDSTSTINNLILPVYRQKGSLKPWVFRTKIQSVLDNIESFPDLLPQKLLTKYELIPYNSAINYIHQPPSMLDLESAIHRLSFDELLALQLESIKLKKSITHNGIAIALDKPALDKFISSLPFALTPSQNNAIYEITTDLESGRLHRLLQGEVGSGKTAVAASVSYAVYKAGYRTVLLAPTGILAAQLAQSLTNYLTPMGLNVSLITGGHKGDSKADVIVGTHAVLSLDKIENLGLVIVDEQHRFGVEQREKLANNKTGFAAPHLLMMTATPIPRTLSMTIFGHLDITRLTGKPPGRLQTKTFYVNESKRADSYLWIRQEINQGNQVFFVTPLIEIAEESDTTPLKSVKELETDLADRFPGVKIEIMHGKLKEPEKQKVMDSFRDGAIQILVATSMIEVGIDIPSANIMVIEDAERFGLAQLHQLRGRVGRGSKQGYCLLFSQSKNQKALDRLTYFVRIQDGEKLAKYDLEKRGPGELFGLSQHGFFNLAIGSIYDEKLVKQTHEAALLLAKSGISP